MKIFLVGGPKDGTRIDVQSDNIPILQLFAQMVNTSEVLGSHGLPTSMFKQIEYRIVPLVGNGKTENSSVYLYQEMTVSDLFKALLERYPQPLEEYMK